MTGITKIQTLNNLGIFENFVWPTVSPSLIFNKTNLLYGYNGCGKTTLANILSLFSEEISEKEKKGLLNDLKSDLQNPVSVHIEWDGKLVRSFDEKKKIFIFNSEFIATHVYNGNQSNIKLFKSGIVTQEQLSNPDIKKLTKQIEDKYLELNHITEEKKALSSLSEIIRQSSNVSIGIFS